MSSNRLPGKVLRSLNGQPMLLYLVQRLRRAPDLPPFQLATSTDPSDDPVAEFCAEHEVPCFRGPLDGVADRFLQAAEAAELDAFIRVSGDSPLLDLDIVRRAVAEFEGSEADLVTNVMPRSYPPGQSAEVLRMTTFRRTVAAMEHPEDHEHVTRYYYRHPEQFRILNFTALRKYPQVHLAVDTPAEWDLATGLLQRMTRPHWEYGLDELMELYAQMPEAHRE
jgi:spore coat polysaccharide biosynthesis protein SpsF (cytidylyltransferase family)